MQTRSRLPVGIAAFVGRERERAKVADLIAHARVVTLTGSGGCGKEVPGAGHAAPLTHPGALAEALAGFFTPARQPP